MTARILTFPGSAGPEQSPPGLPGGPQPPALPTRAPRRRAPLEPVPLRREPRALNEAEERLQARILDGYFCGRRVAQNHDTRTIQRDRRAVEEFLAYVGQPLWDCEPEDFESWSGQLGLVRHLRPGSQRVMQTAVATLFEYGKENPAWQNEVRALCGGRIVQVATAENRVIHTTDANTNKDRRYLDSDEFDTFFETLEAVIEIVAALEPRRLKVFQRDRAMIYTYYAYGLRLSEGHGLDVGSFHPNPDLPELSRFGCVNVWGKGSHGSGPRFRTVPAILPGIRPMLDWYLTEVRPKFKSGRAEEPAMWLSERGTRLCRAQIAGRYKTIVEACGLVPTLFSPHGLRHMYVSHQAAANVPIHFTSTSVGHANAHTTTRYTHLSDEYRRAIAYNIVRSMSSEGDE